MSRFLSILLIAFTFQNVLSAQEEVNWLTWEEALELNKTEKRKIIVDVYTTWCTWCKKMDARTYQRENIAKVINENFYAVRFDAETKNEIIFNNKLYAYVSSFGKKGYHELAEEIMNGRMSYPTTVFIDENLEVIQPIPGFQGPSTFKMIMAYFYGDHYMKTPWHKFESDYKLNPNSQLGPSDFQPALQPVRNN